VKAPFISIAAAAVLTAASGCGSTSNPTAPTRAVARGLDTIWPAVVAAGDATFAQCLHGSGTPSCFSARAVRAAVLGPAPATTPLPPINLAATVSGASVTLTWSAPVGGDPPMAYAIEAGLAPGLANLASISTGGPTTVFHADGVGVGTYYVRVRTVGAAGVSAPSNEVVLRIGPAIPPGAPTGLAEGNRFELAYLRWIAPTSGDRPFTYVIQAGSSPGGTDVAVIQTGSADTSFSGTLPPFGRGLFYVRVSAVNAAGQGPPSNEVALPYRMGHIHCFFPPVTGLTASAGRSALTLNFSVDPLNTYSGFVVSAGTTSGSTDIGHFFEAFGPPVTFSSVPAGTYFIRVAGVNNLNDCPDFFFSNEVAVTVE
jgi:hypothetical protein